MNKSFKFYALIWAIALIVFNVICFVTPGSVDGLSKFTPSFLVGYAFISLSFVGNLICAALAFRAENLKKLFYNLPLITIAYAGLVAMLVVGGVFMAIPFLPAWIGVILCVLILAINAVSVLKATLAADTVGQIDQKIQYQTYFTRNLTVNVESILSRARSDAARADCKRVCEAVRYSDPMSHENLAAIEAQITGKANDLFNAVSVDDTDQVRAVTRKNRFYK